jgi:hypothetical protein
MATSLDIEPRRRGRTLVTAVVAFVVAAGGAAAAIALWPGVTAEDAQPAVDDPFRVLDPPVLLAASPSSVVAPAGSAAAGGVTVEHLIVGADGASAAVVNLSATSTAASTSAAEAEAEAGPIVVAPCGTPPGDLPTVALPGAPTVASQLVVPLGEDGSVCVSAPAGTAVELEAVALLGVPEFSSVTSPVRVLDTRPGSVVVGETAVELALADRDDVAIGRFGMIAASVATIGRDADGSVTVRSCGASTGSIVEVRAGATIARPLIASVGSEARICVSSDVPADVVIDVSGVFAPTLGRPYAEPVVVADTRAAGVTFDGRFAGIGVRPESSTLELPLTSRVGDVGGVEAVLVEVAAVDALEDGTLSVFAAGSEPAALATLRYPAGTSAATTAVVPLARSGVVCVSTTGRTDLVVDVIGIMVSPEDPRAATPETPETARPPTAGTVAPEEVDAPRCPGQQLFTDHRMVALYGSPRSPALGVLGEQDASAAADRLAEIAAPWRSGDRTIRPAFEVIATLATADDGDDGLHRLRSDPEVIQEYLDVARRHGYYLILDIQPGWSDFLTEAQHYEEFLRQPDVGLALDPEWRTRPPDPPRGGRVGQTDAAEVNAVAEWLAQLVAEEHLPEKLLVLHQFQERMIVDRDQVVEPPGVAVTVHMDGFGSRAQKQDTWSKLRVTEPWNNGLKLFFDEDVDMYRADEVLAGAFEPVPDLITYQ